LKLNTNEMPDDYTQLNSGTGGDAIDEESVTYVSSPTTRKRQRIVIGGSSAAQLAAVLAADPSISDYGLTVRNLPKRATTATTSTIASSTTNTTLLSSNTNRLGMTIYNDSTTCILVKLGQTASLMDFTIRMSPKSYYEAPYGYSGQIDGMWEDYTLGSARVTELT
jgi:hypothetical protein